MSSKRSPDEGETGRSARKRRAILQAATELFLSTGYLGASMDDVANLARVSKPTVYKHFSSKEALFVEIVSGMTNTAADVVHNAAPGPAWTDDVSVLLCDYAFRQLEVVLTPRLMQLRRMVIGEVGRFPELGRLLYQAGPQRALTAFAATLAGLAEKGLLRIDDPAEAASNFNWLVMSEPLNRAMLLGDDAIPGGADLRRQAERAVRMFLAAYGTD